MSLPAPPGQAGGAAAPRPLLAPLVWALLLSTALGFTAAADEVRAPERPAPPVVIYGIELESGSQRDRVLVFAEEAFRYRVIGTDPESVEIQISHAVLHSSAATALTPEVVGAVRRVTAFERVADGVTEVRIAIRRPANVAPEVTQRGAMLAIDFPRPMQQERIVLQSRDADLRDIAERVARAAGMDLIIDDALAGRVTITSPDEMSPTEAVELLSAVLLLEGFAPVVTPSRAMKIVPIEGIPSTAPWRAAAGGSGGATVATLHRLARADARQVEAALRPLVGEGTVVQPTPAGDGLILAGPEPRVARAIELAQLLDAAASEDLFVLELRHAGAAEAAEMLRAAVDDGEFAAGRLDVWALTRSNDIVVRGPPTLLGRARSFLRQIDVPIRGGGELRVVPVLHADPEELAEVLRSLGEGARPDDVGGTLAGRQFRVTVDRPTSSLVVLGDRHTTQLVADIVGELDRERRQVELEVVIFEVATLGALDLGFEAIVPFGNPDGGDLFGAVVLDPNGGGLQGVPGDEGFFSRIGRPPLLVPIVGPGGNPVEVLVPQETGVLIANDGAIHTEVLVRPHFTMVSGEEQEIFAGDNIPIPVARSDDSGLGFLETRSDIQREDVGVRVRVRPTLGQEGVVMLDLDVEERRLAPSLAGDVSDVGPTLQQRQLTTTVRVRSGEIAVVGMVEEMGAANVKRGTPYFHDIPAIGWLFGMESRAQLKRNLVIAVQARALPNSVELLAQSIRRRLAFERRTARVAELSVPEDAPYALRVDTLRDRHTARGMADELAAAGLDVQLSHWDTAGRPRHDVYVTGMRSLAETGDMARRLRRRGYEPELEVLRTGAP